MIREVKNLVHIKNVFIDVHDKKNIVMLVDALFKICRQVTIFSSGGTYSHLEIYFPLDVRDGKIILVSGYTGIPETDGGLSSIDLVIVDLYPFDKLVRKEGVTIEECRIHIDVLGPFALKSGATRYLEVMTIPTASAEGYDKFITKLSYQNGYSTLNMRLEGSRNTFKVLAEYDANIANFFDGLSFDTVLGTYKIE